MFRRSEIRVCVGGVYNVVEFFLVLCLFVYEFGRVGFVYEFGCIGWGFSRFKVGVGRK